MKTKICSFPKLLWNLHVVVKFSLAVTMDMDEILNAHPCNVFWQDGINIPQVSNTVTCFVLFWIDCLWWRVSMVRSFLFLQVAQFVHDVYFIDISLYNYIYMYLYLILSLYFYLYIYMNMIRFYVYTCERKGAKPFRGVGSIWGECWFGNVQSPLSFQEGFCWEARVVLNHPFKLDSLEKKF